MTGVATEKNYLSSKVDGDYKLVPTIVAYMQQ